MLRLPSSKQTGGKAVGSLIDLAMACRAEEYMILVGVSVCNPQLIASWPIRGVRDNVRVFSKMVCARFTRCYRQSCAARWARTVSGGSAPEDPCMPLRYRQLGSQLNDVRTTSLIRVPDILLPRKTTIPVLLALPTMGHGPLFTHLYTLAHDRLLKPETPSSPHPPGD